MSLELFPQDLFVELAYTSLGQILNEHNVVRQPPAREAWSQEIEQFMREFLAQWRDFRILGEESKEADGGKVFVGGRQGATGRSSGILVDDSLCSVWTFRQGAVVRLLFERDRRKALEAAGLSE